MSKYYFGHIVWMVPVTRRGDDSTTLLGHDGRIREYRYATRAEELVRAETFVTCAVDTAHGPERKFWHHDGSTAIPSSCAEAKFHASLPDGGLAYKTGMVGGGEWDVPGFVPPPTPTESCGGYV